MLSYSPLPAQPDPLLFVIEALHHELDGLFQVNQTSRRNRGRTIAFIGRLLDNSDAGYDEMQRRFQPHGYTPMLRQERGNDVVLAMRGLIDEGRTGNPLINIVLFIATVITTLAAGAALAGAGDPFRMLLTGRGIQILPELRSGIPFAVSLLSILGIHELGHYFAARRHGVTATLPYFIPMPIGGLGTLGAFIAIRSPMKNRTVLFDIGLAGPIAGFLVAVPLLILGLYLSFPVPYFDLSHGITLRVVGQSLLVRGILSALTDIPAGYTLALHPICFAAWFSLLITGINLLPIGQLDGGHVSYAVLGRHAHMIARVTLVALLLAGAFISYTWFFWAFFVLLGGIRHAPPLNDIAGVNGPRLVLAGLTALLFVLLLVPTPFTF
jgi:membrane-associated protease RseP (regulator of RpoE activity)